MVHPRLRVSGEKNKFENNIELLELTQICLLSFLKVLTIFSASNYYGSDSNLGAFIQLTTRRVVGSTSVESKISIAEPVEEGVISEGDFSKYSPSKSTGTSGVAAETSIAYSRIVKEADSEVEATTGARHVIETLLLPRLITFRTGVSTRRTLSGRRYVCIVTDISL